MARFYGILLIIALIGVSGLIAYVGDLVGRRMGRKRLSLFGMRPRHTAIAISVVAGMLITMLTLATAMLVSPDVRSGFLHVAEMRRQQRDLQKRAQTLSTQAAMLDAQVRAVKAEVDARRRALRTAQEDLARAQSQSAGKQGELNREQQRAARLDADLSKARRLVADRDALLKSAERVYAGLVLEYQTTRQEADSATGELAAERATPVLVGAGQPLDTELVPAGQSAAAVRAQLNRFINRLNDRARAAGSSAVVVRKAAYDTARKTIRWYGRDQVVDALCDEILRAKGGVIVQASAMINTYKKEPLFPDFHLYNNRLVFHRGDVLARATLDGTDAQWALLGRLVGLLKEVGTVARARNMMPRSSASPTDPFASTGSAVGEMSYEELFQKVDAIGKTNGPARVTVFAADDAWTIGPLRAGMRIEAAG